MGYKFEIEPPPVHITLAEAHKLGREICHNGGPIPDLNDPGPWAPLSTRDLRKAARLGWEERDYEAMLAKESYDGRRSDHIERVWNAVVDTSRSVHITAKPATPSADEDEDWDGA